MLMTGLAAGRGTVVQSCGHGTLGSAMGERRRVRRRQAIVAEYQPQLQAGNVTNNVIQPLSPLPPK